MAVISHNVCENLINAGRIFVFLQTAANFLIHRMLPEKLLDFSSEIQTFKRELSILRLLSILHSIRSPISNRGYDQNILSIRECF